MKTIAEVSRLTGLSVRTLHYYDSIGLLSPTAVTEAGYRLYGDEAFGRLRDILFFRELGFPLKEIGRILDSPGLRSGGRAGKADSPAGAGAGSHRENDRSRPKDLTIRRMHHGFFRI